MPQQLRYMKANSQHPDTSAVGNGTASYSDQGTDTLVRSRLLEAVEFDGSSPDRSVEGKRADVTVQHFGLVAGLVERLIYERSATDANVGERCSEAARREDIDPSAGDVLEGEWIERLRTTAVVDNPNDRVIRSLSSALATAEQGDDQYCVDALRLALAIRLLGLRPDRHAVAQSGGPEARGRQARALQKWRLKRVVEYIDNHLPDKVSLQDLAAVAGLSRMHFASQFRVATGLRPHEFLLRRRIRRAEELLRDTQRPIIEIALTVGFETQAHFTTVFKRFAGYTPRRWRAISQAPSTPQPRSAKRVEPQMSCPG